MLQKEKHTFVYLFLKGFSQLVFLVILGIPIITLGESKTYAIELKPIVGLIADHLIRTWLEEPGRDKPVETDPESGEITDPIYPPPTYSPPNYPSYPSSPPMYSPPYSPSYPSNPPMYSPPNYPSYPSSPPMYSPPYSPSYPSSPSTRSTPVIINNF
jgi:hypothetical protein